MDNDINKNLTPEQEAGIKSQDITQPGVVDVSVLEQKAEPLPEPAPPVEATGTLSAADSLLRARSQEKQLAQQAQSEFEKQTQAQREQEAIVRAVSGETIGRADAEAQAMKDANISGAQSEIDALDEAILSASEALKSARVKDQQDIAQLAGRGQGVPASIVRGKQALLTQQRNAERNLQAIELENDIATSQLLQGKVNNAKKAIERAVELKFADKKAELELEKQFLSRIDTKESRARQEKISREEKEIENAETEAQDVFDIAARARQAGASQAEISSIVKSQNREEALRAARSLGQSARLDMQLKRLNISSKSLDIAEQKKKLAELNNPNSSISIEPDFQAATFAKRMADADAIIGSTERDIGEKIGTIASLGLANREERQKRKQAEANFVNALLRKESGAAISPEEFKSAREQYFPTATDTEATRKQKAENRMVVFEGMRVSSGDAYEYLVNEIGTGSPDSLLDSFNIEETPEDFLSDL